MFAFSCGKVAVVAHPTINANRAMTPIMLNEVRICFIFASLLMILSCRFRRSLATAQTNRFALRLARDSARRANCAARGRLRVLDFGRTTFGQCVEGQRAAAQSRSLANRSDGFTVSSCSRFAIRSVGVLELHFAGVAHRATATTPQHLASSLPTKHSKNHERGRRGL